MTKSIPVDFFATVTPSVIDAGGAGLNIVGLLLTNDVRVPIGTVASFASALLVADHFGFGSPEYAFALKYFAGYDGSSIKPAALLIAQYTAQSVPAYLEGGQLGMTLAQLNAVGSGTVRLTVNGSAVTSASVALGSATSFSDAAALLQAALNVNDASFTASVAGNVLTVSAVAAGTLAAGQAVAGASVPAGTVILSQLTGSAGSTGTYQLSTTAGAPITSEAMTSGALTVAYDSLADAFVVTSGTPGTVDTLTVANAGTVATGMKLTAATGAVVSPGSIADVAAATMDAIVAVNPNWVTFSSLFEPVKADKVAFATWANGKNNRYAYVCWSTDVQDATAGDTAGAFYAIGQANLSGTHYIYAPVNGDLTAAFIMGAQASINFGATNGRRNTAFLQQSGLAADVADLGLATILEGKGINFYGVFGSAAQTFFRYYPGAITGPFAWMDSWIDQVWMNDALKLALVELLANEPNIPYNTVGYGKILQHLSDPIQAAVNFGAIRSGIPLSNAQADRVNSLAGADIASTVTQRGWALVIQPASAATRGLRQSPPIFFFYTDGQSIQRLALNSVEVA